MLLTKESLKSHIYPEIVTVISRADDEVVEMAIKTGEAKVKSYLNRFDVITMFNGTYTEPYLEQICKDIVCWYIIKLANANIDLTLFRTAFEDAEKDLEKVQKGSIAPAWPARPDDTATAIKESGTIEWSSNKKRRTHF